MNIGHVFDSLLDFIFPTYCAGCGKAQNGGREICGECFAAIPIRASLMCGRCRARLPEGKKICHSSFPYILGAAADYNHRTVRELVHRLKFHGAKNAASPLGNLVATYVKKLPGHLDGAIVIPVPLGIRRMRDRGFNQAELVARHVAEKLALPLETATLIRTRNTAPQSETESREARLKNVLGCFALAHPEAILGAHILLIDDVVTSGATFFEAAHILKNAGARSIVALAVAEA